MKTTLLPSLMLCASACAGNGGADADPAPESEDFIQVQQVAPNRCDSVGLPPGVARIDGSAEADGIFYDAVHKAAYCACLPESRWCATLDADAARSR
jgi:hypothetical protein